MPKDPRDVFVVNRLRAKPVTYNVEITHLVVQDEWNLHVKVNDVSMENEDERARVVEDLREAADMLEDIGKDKEVTRETAGTFLGYRDADGNEMHCAKEKCDTCPKGCEQPIARLGTQKRDAGNAVPAWADKLPL